MNTRRRLDLTEKKLTDLQLSFNRPKRSQSLSRSQSDSSLSSPIVLKKESSLTNSIQPKPFAQTILIMSEADDLRELEEIKQRQLQLEKKFLDTIPFFKFPVESSVDEFLTQADTVFSKLKYPDDIRLIKISDRFDEKLQPWFTTFRRNDSCTWNNFCVGFSRSLQSSSLLVNPSIDEKLINLGEYRSKETDEERPVLELIRRHVAPFSGHENAIQWFRRLDSKFFEMNLSFSERLEILPHLFYCDAMIWFSLNQEKMNHYTDFCQLFFLEYLKNDSSIPDAVGIDQGSKPLSLHSQILRNKNSVKHSTDDSKDKPMSSDCQSLISSNSNNSITSNSLLSSTISKAIIDRFVKDPIKFSGGKENVITWLDEIDQQFKTMNLADVDKLNLIHICLKGEANQWYKQNKSKFISWSIFVNEIANSFTSNLQRDSSFKKLKQYQQSINQSVMQYYTEMIKLIQQADIRMNESTKVQYLMDGLLSSLATETRRNYPTTAEEFLKQAKIAEELISLNTTFISNSTVNDDSSYSPSFHSPVPINSMSNNEFFDRSPHRTSDRHYQNSRQSPNEPNHHRYLNRISNSSSRHFNRQDQLFQPPYNTLDGSSTKKNPSMNHDNAYRSNSSNQRQRNTNGCFKCGSCDDLARQCHHFEERSQ